MTSRLFPAGLAALMLTGCAGSDPTPFVAAGVQTLADAGATRANLGADAELNLAREKDAQLSRSGKLLADPQAQAYLDEIVGRLSPHRRNARFPITARIIDDPVYNAFTPGGGFLYINSGLIAGLENEAQLAMVVAHEIAHFDEGHLDQNRIGNVAVSGAGRFAGAALGQTGLTGTGAVLAEGATALGLQAAANTFSRTQEVEADRSGFGTLVRAGYDPAQAARTFAIIGAGKTESRLTNALFSSHPMSAARQQALSQMAAGLPPGKVGADEYRARMDGVFRRVAGTRQR